MNPDQMVISSDTTSSKHYLEWTLLILSSVLLGIWAAKDTIALRNILLVVGALLSIYYLAQEYKEGNLKERLSLWKALPVLLLGLAFIWVAIHFFLFSVDPAQQWDELKSTWLRSFLACIIGIATGLVLSRCPNRLTILWLGIFGAFAVLFYQYVPRALEQQKLLVPDYDHYLFHLKINTVLMGTILLAGVDGALFDHLRSIRYQLRSINVWIVICWGLATGMALWSFVYIVDARNGIGLSSILYVFWFACAVILLIQSQLSQPNLKNWFVFLLALASLLVVLFFAIQQAKLNRGWSTLIEDAKIAVQIDRYQHWQNLSQMGYPLNSAGQTVTGNNYERIAWATAGARAILQHPQGVGVLAYPFAKHPNAPKRMLEDRSKPGLATHSGWVELGLAFGLPILSLLLLSLAITFVNAVSGSYPAKMTVLGLAILILFLYTTGEVAIAHGLEILFYLLGLLPALLWVKPLVAMKQ
jgi:ABC-type multidrug transport system fused ATPase/permease subunit